MKQFAAAFAYVASLLTGTPSVAWPSLLRPKGAVIIGMMLMAALGFSQTSTPSLASGWSSSEFVRAQETDLIALKQIATGPVFKLLPKLTWSFNAFTGYNVKTQVGVAGLAALISGPLTGKLNWCVGLGDKIDLGNQLQITSFTIKGAGGIIGIQYGF